MTEEEKAIGMVLDAVDIIEFKEYMAEYSNFTVNYEDQTILYEFWNKSRRNVIKRFRITLSAEALPLV